MSLLDVIQLVTSAAALVGAITVLVALPRRVMRSLDAWQGRPASPGFPAVPGIPERVLSTEESLSAIRSTLTAQGTQLDVIKRELFPNGGASIKDSLGRIEAKLAESVDDRAAIHRELDTLARRLPAAHPREESL